MPEDSFQRKPSQIYKHFTNSFWLTREAQDACCGCGPGPNATGDDRNSGVTETA